MEEEHRCRECKWLTGEKRGSAYECMQPEKQAKWNNQKNLWMGELRKTTARYKQRGGLACKKFEPLE